MRNAIKTLPWELGTLIWLRLLIVGTVRNMKRNTKEVRGSTSDIISNLLENIKATVLVCLPIQDAVRTSVLSTKWRLESCPEMDQLILFLSDNGIQEFTLPIQKGEPYKLIYPLLEKLSLKSSISETSKLVTLFGSLPVIEFLLLEYHTIRVRRCETTDVIDHVLQLLEMQDWSDVSLNQLQAVELGNLSGT
ncbi:unnamed protein product [Camellia sinensis]